MNNLYRITPQRPMNFDGLVIDNFAGGGGASTGIEMGLGRAVDIAINHDIEAIAMHTVNHPHTTHYCESVWDINPRVITKGRPVELAWFSPDCKHFSKAKGAKPVSKNIRGLAWVAIRYAATVKPKVIMLENVEEFTTWCPLDKDGMPDKAKKGQTFNSFINALKRQGYHVEHKELVASDYGTPTSRKRLFLVARRDGLPIIWPEITHGSPKAVKEKNLKLWKTAADIIDWSIPCPSIFNRKKPLADNTMKRIAKGLMKYVINSKEPFTITPSHPLSSIKNNKYLIAPFLTEHANASNQRNMATNEPLRTLCAQVKGGHFAVVAPILIPYYGQKSENEARAHQLNEPLRTQTTCNRHALVCAFLAKHYTGVVGSSINDPVHTITTVDHNALVQAFLISYYGNSTEPLSINEPLDTVTTKDRFALITIHGQDYQIIDIGMRMLAPHELYVAQGFPNNYIFDRTADGKKLTKTAQIRMCGNSVCPPVAAALVKANLVDTATLLIERKHKNVL